MYNCSTPILYSGNHLDHLNLHLLKPCNRSVILEALKMETDSNCRNLWPCSYLDFFIDRDIPTQTITEIANSGRFVSTLRIIFNEPVTEIYNSFISVNEQTLIGQVGGIMGITLGWSGLTLIDLIEPTLNTVAKYITI